MNLRTLLEGERISVKNKEVLSAEVHHWTDRCQEVKSGSWFVAVPGETKNGHDFIQEAIKQGRPSPLTTQDFLQALKKSKATTREWFATARNHALYSNQGGVYDEILDYLKLK